MMKPTFLHGSRRPLLVCLIGDMTDPAGCIATMRGAMYDGADAFAIHLDRLDRKYHTIEDLTGIFNYAADKPVMAIIHRTGSAANLTDEEIVATHLLALEAGATMCDILGDMFDPSPMELSRKPAAVDGQRRLIDQIHRMGGEVLLSSHTWVFMTAEQTVEHAKELESRGADMVKIAMCAHSEEEMAEVYKTTVLLRQELKIPFLHVCMGQHGKLHRAIAPVLGSALALCVLKYTPGSHREQVLLRATKAVFDNLDWTIARNELLGTRLARKEG
jgi:3-dehydroquinate dehydratase type I